jgi:alcohol dehydrogenase class IV
MPAEPRPPALHVGHGVLSDLGSIVSALGVTAPLIVTDSGLLRSPWPLTVASSLARAGLRTTRFGAVDGTPSESVVASCRTAFLTGEHDGVVAVGGGSAIDTAKACSGLVGHGGQLADYYGLGHLTHAGPPIIAVPTTPSTGADVSFHAVIAADERRFAVSGPHLRPVAVVADQTTWHTAPRDVVGDAVVDALIHGIEAYLALAATPATDQLSLEGVSDLFAAAGVDDPRLAHGCIATGMAMSYANAGLVHALGYPLSTEYGLSHGRANALVAAAALACVHTVAPDRCRMLAAKCGTTDLARAVADLCRRFGVSAAFTVELTDRDALRLADKASAYQPLLDNAPIRVSPREIAEIYLAVSERSTSKNRSAMSATTCSVNFPPS